MSAALDAHPGWLAPGVVAPSVPRAARVTDQHAAQYGEWFAWAMKHVSDPRAGHASAAAATVAELDGADRNTAAIAAQQAATQPPLDAAALPVDASVVAYAPWYAWSRNDLGLDPGRAAVAASAGMAAAARGEHYEVAANAARQAAGLVPVPIAMPVLARGGSGALGWFADPAARGLGWGVLCLVAPFTIHFVFPLLPVFGLIYGFRAIMKSRTVIGIAGLAVNGLALAVTLLVLFAHA
jgi:hypothetical protein